MSRVLRGQYGPIPAETVTPTALRHSRRALWLAALFGRHLAFPFGLRTASVAERRQIEAAAGDARFDPWCPLSLPVGFSVEGVDVVPYSRDVMTIRLADGHGRALEISQRAAWLPLEEELVTAGVPFDRVPGSRPIYLMHGKYGGEPIDLSFWSTRHALVVERRGVRIECREMIGRGPGLSALIRLACSALRHSRGGTVTTSKEPGGLIYEEQR